MTTGQPHECALCGWVTKPRQSEDQHPQLPPVGVLCARCGQRFLDNLDEVLRSWEWLTANPGTIVGTNAIGGGEPNVPGGTGRLTYLATGMNSPHGLLTRIAGEQHQGLTGRRVAVPRATLPLIVAAIRTDFVRGGCRLDDVPAWALVLAQLAAEGRDLRGATEQGQWVTCPSSTGEGMCGRRLRIDVAKPTEPVTCRQCSRVWTTLQLLNLALNTDDAWADPESAAQACGVTVTQVKRWTHTARVRTQHSLVALADVRAAKADALTAAHTTFRTRLRVETIDPRTRCATCGEWITAEGATIAAAQQAVQRQLDEHRRRHDRTPTTTTA